MTGSAQATFRLTNHVIIATAVALIAPFTLFAWPFAIATGFVIAADERERRSGVSVRRMTSIIRVFGVTGGVLGMLLAGALLGGIVALAITALTVVSERMSADAPESDRMIARLLLGIGAIVGFVVFSALFDLNVSIGLGA